MRCCNPFFVEEEVRREAGPGRWLKVSISPQRQGSSQSAFVSYFPAFGGLDHMMKMMPRP